MFRNPGGILSLAAAAALFATAAVAQPAPPPAQSVAPSARQLELAHRYMQAIHMDRMMDGMVKNTLPAMMAQMPKTPNMSDADRQAIGQIAGEAVTEMMTTLMARMEPIMAETFTEKELTDLVAFYEGPTGRAVIDKTPQMMARLTPTLVELMPQMQARMRARLCARIDCSAATKAPPPKPS